MSFAKNRGTRDKAMVMENALNLDDGGSTALYSGGYKVGPGRDLPNAVLFVRK